MLQLSPHPLAETRALFPAPVTTPESPVPVPTTGQTGPETKAHPRQKSSWALAGLLIAATVTGATLVFLPPLLIALLFFLPALLPVLVVIAGMAATAKM